MEDGSARRDEFEARLDRWRAEIDGLRARAAEAGADARIEHAGELEELEERRQAARRRLHEFEAAGGEAWRDLRAGMYRAWGDLAEAPRHARERIG